MALAKPTRGVASSYASAISSSNRSRLAILNTICTASPASELQTEVYMVPGYTCH